MSHFFDMNSMKRFYLRGFKKKELASLFFFAVSQFQGALKDLVEPEAVSVLLWNVNQSLRYLLCPSHVPAAMLNTLMKRKVQCAIWQWDWFCVKHAIFVIFNLKECVLWSSPFKRLLSNRREATPGESVSRKMCWSCWRQTPECILKLCGRLYFPKPVSLMILLILYVFWETWHPLIKMWALIPLPLKLSELLTHL